ncbi:hypothetical protein B0T19DRAFT_405905 [Cercophora scortea]|uniref:Mg2+ transporter protein, CorA-like/Zinc transport protein ZntB n=1 Tax=Cercophora scortea TaxID=314031 RepID=A0AAE0J1M2_9PEZI|nr:hypothetical protein B0T19DRAFT_405905 [Cercophora scortea]
MVSGDPCASKMRTHPEGRAMQIRSDTFSQLVKTVGFAERPTNRFLETYIPTMSFHLQYDDPDDDEKATSMTILLRCPKNSNSVTALIRIQFATMHCMAFISCCKQEDTEDLRRRCIRDADLLRLHPLYILATIYEHRYIQWTNWFSSIWRDVVEIETLTNMTHEQWKLDRVDPSRLQSLSKTDTLLTQLHATHLELCHCRTVMTYGGDFGTFSRDALAELEKGRRELGLRPLSARHRSGLEESMDAMKIRCGSVMERLSELKERLVGQITVSYNLIAQKDSKVNLTVAKLQFHDSRMLKGIAFLTLLFLPSTLVATLWTTNLFQISGDTNWHVYLVVSLLLTIFVFFCWGSYVRWSRQRQELHWPERATIDTIYLSNV